MARSSTRTSDPLATINTRATPQSQPADPRQVRNSAGGFVFDVSADTRVHRFLTLGTAGGTFYVGERETTKDNADVILTAARERGSWLVEQVVAVSLAGRALRQQPAIFALAAVAGLGDDAARSAALTAVPQVCRTGSTLFTFAGYVEQFRGWGRGLRRAIAAWYAADNFDADSLAYQLVKYRQREGWSHRDLLRLAHPKVGTATDDDAARRAALAWATGHLGLDQSDALPAVIRGHLAAQAIDHDRSPATAGPGWAGLVQNFRLPWEALPDAALGHAQVWRAMIDNGMPIGALLRQLPRLTRVGVLDDREVLATVIRRLTDREQLRRGRIHPVALLLAQRTYASGHSLAGSSTWQPKRELVDALDAGFYAAFETVEPAGKRTLLALDVSGSMGSPAGGTLLSCREASAAMALVTMATEPGCEVVGFTSGSSRAARVFGEATLTPLDLSPRRRLDDNVAAISGLPFGGTDCALPMTWATVKGKVFDTFVIYTDNETWAGGVHPHQALARYRREINPAARLAVVALTPTRFSIADPDDPGQLDVSGFDGAVPTLLRDFSAGQV